jgi:hypothetical protein
MKINYKIVANHLGVKLRGNETFTELLEIEKQLKRNKERMELLEEKRERIAEQNANIQRVDAQTKKYWGK